MTILEVWYKSGFGKRLRKITTAMAGGLHKLNDRMYSSLPQHGGQVDHGVGGGGGGGHIITATVAGTGTDTATITFAGGPAIAMYTVTVSATVGGEAIAGIQIPAAAILIGGTADKLATDIVTAIDGKKDAGNTVEVEAVKAGLVVTVTEVGGADIDALTVNIT